MPTWLGAWFEIYPVWETLAAQALAAIFVVGSYYAAEYVKVKRPQRRGAAVTARRATAPPVYTSPSPSSAATASTSPTASGVVR